MYFRPDGFMNVCSCEPFTLIRAVSFVTRAPHEAQRSQRSSSSSTSSAGRSSPEGAGPGRIFIAS
jgi:hypothetical protein